MLPLLLQRRLDQRVHGSNFIQLSHNRKHHWTFPGFACKSSGTLLPWLLCLVTNGGVLKGSNKIGQFDSDRNFTQSPTRFNSLMARVLRDAWDQPSRVRRAWLMTTLLISGVLTPPWQPDLCWVNALVSSNLYGHRPAVRWWTSGQDVILSRRRNDLHVSAWTGRQSTVQTEKVKWAGSRNIDEGRGRIAGFQAGVYYHAIFIFAITISYIFHLAVSNRADCLSY